MLGSRASVTTRAPVLSLISLLGCHPQPGASILDQHPLPRVVAEQPSYAGTWVGPELSLSFVGPWVLVRPTAEPERAPIELRATVERREGDAYALRVSVAGVWPADFLRPSDWTMLVEDGQLALAMGDEPLASYVASERVPVLHGPIMLDELAVQPREPGLADGVACLEVASDRCAALEAEGPLAAGCRELQWSLCLTTLGPGPADPIARSAQRMAETIHRHLLMLRYAGALLEARDPAQHGAAQQLFDRARRDTEVMLDELAREGPLPDDPHLPELLARVGR
jgi:hypothetical protein